MSVPGRFGGEHHLKFITRAKAHGQCQQRTLPRRSQGTPRLPSPLSNHQSTPRAWYHAPPEPPSPGPAGSWARGSCSFRRTTPGSHGKRKPAGPGPASLPRQRRRARNEAAAAATRGPLPSRPRAAPRAEGPTRGARATGEAQGGNTPRAAAGRGRHHPPGAAAAGEAGAGAGPPAGQLPPVTHLPPRHRAGRQRGPPDPRQRREGRGAGGAR